MADAETGHGLQQAQRHPSNFAGVVVAVSDRKRRHDHVGITDRFHLPFPQ
jgi:hypothetical protein